MNGAPPPLKQLNRTFIGSVLFIDIVGYSKRTVPDQLAMKELFNTLLAEAIHNVAPSDRIMVDTGDGAAIAFIGDPEDALFAALSLRDAVDTGKATEGEPGFVRMGINLGPLKMVRDINGHTNVIGDGVNDAQRVMSFAEPGQVMVAHSYYDIISRFSRDYAQLFVYEGTRHDKHVREYEVYRFGPVEDNENLAEKLRDRSRARQISAADSFSLDPLAALNAAAQARNTAAARPTLNKAVSRSGLIATMVGAVSVVSAVWSWTSTPAPGNSLATSSPPVAYSPQAAAASSVAEESKPAEIKSAAAKQSSARVPEDSSAAQKPQQLAVTASASSAPEKPAAGKSDEKVPALAPAKPGTMKLAVQPWGEIYVDGSKRGISPPLKSLSLPPGKHRVEIRNGQFAPHKQTVEVKSGAETTVRYTF